MKSTNKKLIKLLGTLDILESEVIKEDNPKTENDITYTVKFVAGGEHSEYRVLPESVDDETVALLLKAEQLKTLKGIKKMLIFFVVVTLINIVIAIWSGISIALVF